MTTTRYSLFATLFFCLGLLLAGPAARAQAPGWQAATAIATSAGSQSEISFTATDASGNVVVAGGFQGTIALGSFTLSSSSPNAAFVAKWNVATGTWAWAQQLGGTAMAFVGGLAVAGGSVYLSGSFKGSFAAGSLSLSSPAAFDAFVVKLADSGPTANWVWAQQAGGTADDFGYAVAVQGSSLYVVGLSYTRTFGTITLATSGPNTSDALVAKLTDAGTAASWVWAQQAGGTNDERVEALVVSGSAVYVAGDFYSPAATFGATTLVSAGNNDIFVAKLLDAGATSSWAWAQRAGGPGHDTSAGLAVRGSQVYVSGDVADSPATFGSTTLTPTGNVAGYVARLVDAGSTATFAWAQAVATPSLSTARALTLGTSQLYVGGITIGPTTFGSIITQGNGSANYGYLATIADAALLPTTAAATLATAMAVVPNPTHGPATVQLPAGLAAGPATLTLLDAVGRPVRTTNVALAAGATIATFDVAGLAPGVYALRVAVGERRGTARLVVE